MTGSDPRTASAAPLTGPAAPCWVTLMTRDLETAERFYTQVLGWSFRPGRLGADYYVAYRGEVPVAGVFAVSSAFQVAVAWTPYFAVEDADVAAARVRERSGTVAVGPLTLGKGRGVLASDRDGASFGLWERTEASASPPAPAGHAHAWLRLRTRNAFDAAIFYGEVLDWASGRPGCCDVAYEGDEVIVRCGGIRWPGSAPGPWRRLSTRWYARTGRSSSRWRTLRRRSPRPSGTAAPSSRSAPASGAPR